MSFSLKFLAEGICSCTSCSWFPAHLQMLDNWLMFLDGVAVGVIPVLCWP